VELYAMTPEERQRIEEEERKRIAEEQYRDEVRARILAEYKATVATSRNRDLLILGIAALVILGGIIAITSSRTAFKASSDPRSQITASISRSPVVDQTRYVPVTQKIATGQVLVRANGYLQYRITITPEMIKPTVTGSFTASGGSGNDIQAAILDEPNYPNWINGHAAKVFWSTEGKQTTGSFEVKLSPGMYYFVLNNRFSLFTSKQVFLEVDLTYQKAEGQLN
jgi:hypothetical protein